MIAALSADTGRFLYAVAFFIMVAAAVYDFVLSRKVTWAVLVATAWAVVMFVWWSP